MYLVVIFQVARTTWVKTVNPSKLWFEGRKLDWPLLTRRWVEKIEWLLFILKTFKARNLCIMELPHLFAVLTQIQEIMRHRRHIKYTTRLQGCSLSLADWKQERISITIQWLLKINTCKRNDFTIHSKIWLLCKLKQKHSSCVFFRQKILYAHHDNYDITRQWQDNDKRRYTVILVQSDDKISLKMLHTF